MIYKEKTKTFSCHHRYKLKEGMNNVVMLGLHSTKYFLFHPEYLLNLWIKMNWKIKNRTEAKKNIYSMSVKP